MSRYECAVCGLDYDNDCSCLEPVKRLSAGGMAEAIYAPSGHPNCQGNMVDRPPHYNQGDIECLDAMVAAFGLEAVQIHAKCCAFKYLWRAGHKDSDPSQDLAKAVFYTRFSSGDDPRKDR